MIQRQLTQSFPEGISVLLIACYVCQVTIDIELWDSAANGGVGRKLAHASVDLDLHSFEPFKAQSASVELLGKESKVQP